VVTPTSSWDGGEYQARFDALAAEGVDVHGEVRFVLAFSPASVLDAGCGTGRVAIELDRRGVDVVGVDLDPSMLATARGLAPGLRFVQADLADPTLDLGRAFSLVVLAGNVPLFTPPGTQPALVAGCARHLAPGGLLVAGFSLGRGYELDAYDDDCHAAGLALAERWATWDRAALEPGGAYAVSVHRLRP
jgi:SAM-dependent methyltransferase